MDGGGWKYLRRQQKSLDISCRDVFWLVTRWSGACCSLVWPKSLLPKTGLDRLVRDQSSFGLYAAQTGDQSQILSMRFWPEQPDHWATAPLQRLANHWVAWGGRFHSTQFKTALHLPAVMECRLCLSTLALISCSYFSNCLLGACFDKLFPFIFLQLASILPVWSFCPSPAGSCLFPVSCLVKQLFRIFCLSCHLIYSCFTCLVPPRQVSYNQCPACGIYWATVRL
jgi:hypothetical protein